MIGAAKGQIGVPYQSLFSATTSPSHVYVPSTNGASSSPLVRSDVLNGVGPFAYLWEITGDKITIDAPEKKDTSFSSGGFNDFYKELATLKVTDTGNNNEVTTVDVSVIFEFNRQGPENVQV